MDTNAALHFLENGTSNETVRFYELFAQQKLLIQEDYIIVFQIVESYLRFRLKLKFLGYRYGTIS